MKPYKELKEEQDDGLFYNRHIQHKKDGGWTIIPNCKNPPTQKIIIPPDVKIASFKPPVPKKKKIQKRKFNKCH